MSNGSSTGNCRVVPEGVSESGTGQDDEHLAGEKQKGELQVHRFGGSQRHDGGYATSHCRLRLQLVFDLRRPGDSHNADLRQIPVGVGLRYEAQRAGCYHQPSKADPAQATRPGGPRR